MSKEYPCIYNEKGICKFYTTEDITTYCLEGPCRRQKLSNADRIRAMSDEELAVLLADEIPHGDCYGCHLNCWHMDKGNFEDSCQNAWYGWLKQPAEE